MGPEILGTPLTQMMTNMRSNLIEETMHCASDSSLQKLPQADFEKEKEQNWEGERETDLPLIVQWHYLAWYAGYSLVGLMLIPAFLCSPQHWRRLETLKQYFPAFVAAESWLHSDKEGYNTGGGCLLLALAVSVAEADDSGATIGSSRAGMGQRSIGGGPTAAAVIQSWVWLRCHVGTQQQPAQMGSSEQHMLCSSSLRGKSSFLQSLSSGSDHPLPFILMAPCNTFVPSSCNKLSSF